MQYITKKNECWVCITNEYDMKRWATFSTDHWLPLPPAETVSKPQSLPAPYVMQNIHPALAFRHDLQTDMSHDQFVALMHPDL